jgi:hypothetical protein
MSKRCITCGLEKPLSDYYKHPQMSDGHLSKCKECQKANSRAARAARIEDYREYDRARSMRPDRVAMRLAYAQTERSKEITAIGSAAWIKRNPDKRKAHTIVGNALRTGRLIKMPCEKCGNPSSQAHHDDYSAPLSVRWFCVAHHAEHHAVARGNR